MSRVRGTLWLLGVAAAAVLLVVSAVLALGRDFHGATSVALCAASVSTLVSVLYRDR